MTVKIKIFSNPDLESLAVAINRWMGTFEGTYPGIVVHGVQVAQGECFVGTLLYTQGQSESFGKKDETYH